MIFAMFLCLLPFLAGAATGYFGAVFGPLTLLVLVTTYLVVEVHLKRWMAAQKQKQAVSPGSVYGELAQIFAFSVERGFQRATRVLPLRSFFAGAILACGIRLGLHFFK